MPPSTLNNLGPTRSSIEEGENMPTRLRIAAYLLAMGAAPALAQPTIEFGSSSNVSDTPTGTARSDYRIVVDQTTLEKLHVVAYADGPEGQRDIFVRFSTDAATWSLPVNVSNTAGQTNVLGAPGHSRRPALAVDGDEVLVVWNDRFCPGGNQGSYTPAGGGATAFACIWVARSTDAGRTWSAAEQLTDGSRDAINPFPAASADGFALSWQEDPAGVPAGGSEGASGASGTPGTDIHYSAISKLDFVSATPFPAPVQLSDNTATTSGEPRATRPNLQLAGPTALLAYEETKPGAPGKDVRYHAFAFLTPPTGSAGSLVNQVPSENARRVRIVAQSTAAAGSNGATAMILWRQGTGTQDAPADFMMRRATGGYAIGQFDDAVNLSGDSLGEPTDLNPDDSIRGHRGILDGSFAAVVFIYTPSEADRALQQTNYNVMTRRSFDGAQTWSPMRDVSQVGDLTRTAFAPRIVATPPSIASGDPLDVRNPDVYFLAWDTRENLPEVDEAAERYDAFAAITTDRGDHFSPPVLVAGSASAEWETGVQAWPSGEIVCAIWKQRDPGDPAETWFRCGERGLLPVLAVPLLGVPALLIVALGFWLVGGRRMIALRR
jgi:hypothetical protein